MQGRIRIRYLYADAEYTCEYLHSGLYQDDGFWFEICMSLCCQEQKWCSVWEMFPAFVMQQVSWYAICVCVCVANSFVSSVKLNMKLQTCFFKTYQPMDWLNSHLCFRRLWAVKKVWRSRSYISDWMIVSTKPSIAL